MTDQTNHLPQCRAACASGSTEFTHVLPETTSEGAAACRCFKPKDEAPSDAQPIYQAPMFMCKVDNLTALATGDMGQIYVDNCLEIPATHADAKQRVANGEYRVVSDSTYSCFADTNRCFVRSSLQQQQSVTATSSSTSESAAVGTATPASGTVVTPSATQPAATSTATTQPVAAATVGATAPVVSTSDGSTSADAGITISLSNASVATTPETTATAAATNATDSTDAPAQRPHNPRYVHPSGYALAPPPTATVFNGANAVTAIY